MKAKTMIKTKVNSIQNELIECAQQFYGTQLKEATVDYLKALPKVEQVWLLNEYKQELNSNQEPDLSHLY
jgi:hypothetical protein